MELDRAIIDLYHIFDDSELESKETIIPGKVYVVYNKNAKKQLYYKVKKGEKFSFNQYLFLNRCEKSFELIYPSIISISGFSVQKPYVYYKYDINLHKIDEVTLSNDNVQIICYGIASCLSYLLSKGFYYTDFSVNSLLFDKFDHPKLFDYIDVQLPGKNIQYDLISKYAEVITFILNKAKKENSQLTINSELLDLLDRSKKTTNTPTFNDFITFFATKSFCINFEVNKNELFTKYIDSLCITDQLIFDPDVFDSNIIQSINCDSESSDSIYIRCSAMMKTKNRQEKLICILNALPECKIKFLAKYNDFLSKLKKYLYYEDLSLIFSDLNELFFLINDDDPFQIYKKLMEKIKILENQKKDKILDIKIDSLRIQAIHYLKKAYKKYTNDVKIKIELAIQYINGSILPYNLNKALKILKTIGEVNKSTKKLVEQMKTKIEAEIQSESIDSIKQKLSPEKHDILMKAKNEEDVLSILFCGFSFYTGFNGFPILRPLSIQLYRSAAKKSAQAMTVLGELYLKGVIFPKNFKRAKNCFQRAAEGGSPKAEIIYNLLGKHLWRSYLVEYDIDEIINNYLPSFESINIENLFIFSQMNYHLENNINSYMHTLKLTKQYEESENELYLEKDEKSKNKLHSEKDEKSYSMIFEEDSSIPMDIIKTEQRMYRQKIIFPSKDLADIKDIKQQIRIAKNYFYGINGFPVDYCKAEKLFELAAENDNFDKKDLEAENCKTEAQWRFSIACFIYYFSFSDRYLKESSNKNLTGKLLYALNLKNMGNTSLFEHIIQECCNEGSADALYYYALHLENVKKTLSESISNYQKAADKGHIDSLIRLIYITEYENQELKKNKKLLHKRMIKNVCNGKKDTYKSYLKLSAAILNEPLLIKLIHYYDKKKKYHKSNILIQIGIKMNYQLFNAFYADHLLNGKGIETDVERAEKLALIAYNDKYPQQYWERYIYIMLEIYIKDGRHKEAAEFLLRHKSSLTEKYRTKFLLFYMKLDKNIAREYFISVNFCNKYYQECHDYLIEFRKKGNNILKTISNIQHSAFFIGYKNPYSIAILGKIHKEGKYVVRDLKVAIQLIVLSAEAGCPLGYYYLGKEYFYGRFIEKNYDKALKYLSLALKNHGEPRAGYYIYKIPKKYKDESIDDISLLKESALFGHKRALYKYGHLILTRKYYYRLLNEIDAKNFIMQAASQKYKKAIRYCKLHHLDNNYVNNYNPDLFNISEIESASDIMFRSELYYYKNEYKKNADAAKSESENLEKSSDEIAETNPELENNIDDEKIPKEGDEDNEIPIEKEKSISDGIINSDEIKSSKKRKDNEKNSDLSIDEDDDDISDLIAFWF